MIIKTENLVKKFGNFTALDNINLNISAGSIHGFVGPNGAGKTTTIKILIGAVNPTKGYGEIGGYKLGSIEAKKMIGYVPEKANFYDDMNAIEYLIYMGKIAGMTEENAIVRAKELLDLFGLIPFQYRKPNKFSSGMRKKVMIAQALMNRPKIIILDEPTANLDPETRIFIMETLRKLVKKDNITVFISSHILAELELLVDEVTLINRGKILLGGSIDKIRNRFNQGIIDIDTSDNKLLKSKLETIDYIDEIKNVDHYLKIYSKEILRLKKEIGKIIFDLDIALNSFVEEKVTLDNIYKNVFSLNNGGEEK